MVHIASIDWIIIVLYFLVMMVFGSYYGRYVKTAKDFFFGGQRFAWWLVAFSCIATLVGSYSFIKYSANAYKHGFSSSMSYLNDWMWLPLMMFGWIPIIYYSKIQSIPEYFEKRFDKKTRMMLTIFMLVYLVGYIGINLYTMGVCLNPILHMTGDKSLDFYIIVIAIAVACAVYVTAGGQTAVIMTDLLQGVLLLIAGVAIFWIGINYLGGFSEFWKNFPPAHRFGLARFNDNPSFNFVGVFWQDGIANSAVFWFMNQGIIMRFLSTRSVKDGRKTMLFVILALCPIATFAIDSTGWLGTAMVNKGLLPPEVNSEDIFLNVAYRICQPGLFGLILAALAAALMSTIDTLINAVSAIWVNDVWRPYVKPDRDDNYYLGIARWVSIIATVISIGLVPIYKSVGSIYEAHGIFTATITPPMAVALLFAMTWKKYSSTAAFWTLLGGAIAMFFGMLFPGVLVKPFAHGTPIQSGLFQGYIFIHALYGLVCAAVIAVLVSLFTKPKPEAELEGLVIGPRSIQVKRYKGSEPNNRPGKIVRLKVQLSERIASVGGEEFETAVIPAAAWQAMDADPGDIIYVCDPRWWYGGLKSVHTRAAKAGADADKDTVYLSKAAMESAKFTPGQTVTLEKML